MRNLVCIVAGEPNSINSELIGKLWRKKKLFHKVNFFVIGNFNLLKKQFKATKTKIKIQKISNINKQNFKKKLLILDVPLLFQNPFKVSKKRKYKYIINSFNKAISYSKKGKIVGFINCPINKSEIFGKKDFGITEFLATKEKVFGKEAMLIYNKNLAVSPITTHIKLKRVSSILSKKLIINKIITINKFYSKNFNLKPRIGILGLNPHNYEFRENSEEKTIIIPALKALKKRNILVKGPISADTAFLNFKKKGFDVIVGMYHDQVLSPFKTLFKFDAINITLGLPYIRISPDHGTSQDLIRKNLANPKSLIEAVKFFNKINART